MQIDRGSLSDLGIIDPWSGDRDLLSFIDKTQLPESREELRKLLQAPLAEPSAIAARQRDLRQLHRVSELPWKEAAKALDRSELYLASNHPPLLRTLIVRFARATTGSKDVRLLTDGLRATQRFIGFVQRLSETLGGFEAGAELNQIRLELNTFLENGFTRRLVAAKGSTRLSSLDALVRRDAREIFYRVFSTVRRVDALISLGRLQSLPGFVYPEIVTGASPFIDAKAVFHPLLREPVANDVSLGDRTRVTFMTGPNMAGKSTYLRSVAVLVVLAQVGAAVPAHSARLSPFNRLFAAVTVRDSLSHQESFFLAEVRRVGALVQCLHSDSRVLAIVDEMFKGTNVHDATEATGLVVRGLAGSESAVAIVASHLAELGDQFMLERTIRLLHFSVEIDEGRPRFDYRLRDGVSHARIGMHILAMEGIIDGLERLSGSSSGPGACRARE